MSKRWISIVTLLAAIALSGFALAACSSGAAPSEPAKPTAAAAPAQGSTAAPAAAPTQGSSTAPAAAPTQGSSTVPAAGSFPKMDIKLGHTLQVDASMHQGALKFSDLVKQRTNGAVNVQVFPNSQLGSEKDMIEQTQSGMIQMVASSAGMFSAYKGWGPVGVLGMPYILKGNTEEEQYASFVKVIRGPIMTEIANNAIQVSGFRALDLGWWYGQRHLTTKAKQVTKVDDLKGLKVRTPDSPVQMLAMKSLGATVTPMALAELFTALQQGTVDGQENPLNTIYTQKYYEVQKYLSLTGHMTQHNALLMNEKFYQSVSPELRAIFDKSAVEAGEYQSDLQLKANKQNLQDLKDKGMVVSTIDKAEFAAKTKDAWKTFESDFGPGLYEKVKAAIDAS